MNRPRCRLAVVALLSAALAGGCSKPQQVEVVFTDPAPAEPDVEAPVPPDPVEPDPTDPTEPVDPTDPVDPVDPVEPDDTVVDVGHRRELRGAWVATVYGINWPSSAGASAAVKEAELRALITTLASRGVNAVFFQVRPESDALYRSDLEPWSRFLTGTQGRDPGFDPLQVAIDTAHDNNVELHAWINPYRGLSSSTTTAATNHVTRTLASDAIDYDGMVWMDPSSTTVRAHVVEVVDDIVQRYSVDGIHFDDYFYPYPGDGGGFPDSGPYDAYVSDGGSMSKGDWRRDNVNALIADVSQLLRDTKPSVRFGVSPFGIYQDGVPAGIRGLDAYEAISCDPVAWIDNDWVDYLAPQLYWPTTQTAQAFGTLLPWWASLTDDDGRFIVAGLNLTELGSDAAWTVDEYRDQLAIIRDHDDVGARGAILYHADPLLSDQDGIGEVFSTELWPSPALPPPVVVDTRIPALPTVVLDPSDAPGASGGTVTLGGLSADDRGWAIYVASGADDPARNGEAGYVIQQLVPSSVTSVTLPAGRFAITAVGDNDRESRGVIAVVR